MHSVAPLVAFTIIVSGAVLGFAGCNSSRRSAHDGPIDGASLFSRSCAPCHGATGNGDPRLGVPDLSSASALTRAKDDHAIRHRIKFGAGRMPPFGGTLDDAEMDALVVRIREMQR